MSAGALVKSVVVVAVTAALGSGARPTATRPVVKEKTTDAVVNTMSLLRR
jgi:hypothetical protein